MREIRIRTESKIQLVDVTERVNKAVAAIGAKSGLCNLYVPHTTAAIIVSENWDPDVTGDLLKRLEHLVPRDAGYRHGEGNSQAHILSVMLGTSLNIPVRGGALALGRWQGVMFAEFDGRRDRSLIVTLVPLSEG
ncbi:MAG TPA: secondary thiamine-phosphate synthase enzyme YjbQ [Candidatus Binataceae bacterium]|nr:secondary thiamine-phosphate synthase enzyme YjbQ [Candidatus Binataceae bacterium]